MNNSWGFTESLRPSQSWRKPGWQTRRVPGSWSSDVSLSLSLFFSVRLALLYSKMRNGHRLSLWKVLSHKGQFKRRRGIISSLSNCRNWFKWSDFFFPSVSVWTSLWWASINIAIVVLFVLCVRCIIYENCLTPFFSRRLRASGDKFPLKQPFFF